MEELGGLRILIVDDLPDLRAAAQELLEGRGHVVVAGVGGRHDALEAAARHDPDLVLLDIRLEGESGFDVAHALAARCPGLPVVLMSMGDVGPSSELVAACGARGFVLKDRLMSADLGSFLEI